MTQETLEIGYGQEHVKVTIDKDRLAGVYYPNTVDTTDEGETIRQALANPVGSPNFEKFLEGGGKILVIVNDGTRPTPTAQVMDEIGEALEQHSPDYIIATGCHRAATEEELQFIFGKWLDKIRDRVTSHDARNDEMVALGTSKAGTVMEVNKLGYEADKIVIIGSVEPHYFAGFTGGRKAFLPGIASYNTIEMNHKYALLPDCAPLALHGNPVHEDMIDALKEIEQKPIFSIQTVLDRERRTYAVTAGDIHGSFDAAIDAANQVFCVDLPQREDICISVAPYPMDIDLYQTQKCLENGKLALNNGGILIMVSKCRTGIGGKTFYDLLSSQDTPESTLATIDEKYVLGYHKAASMAEIMTRMQIWGVTDLEDEVLEKIFITPKAGIQEALDEALALKPDAKVIVLPEGSITVPKVD